MGLLQEGRWVDQWFDTGKTGGRFIRQASVFRNWVTVDGSAGPTGVGGFPAEPHRYHLYVSMACPWAHRTLILRKLKGLEDAISLSVVHWHMGENGWTFEPGIGVIPDPINSAQFLYQIYTASSADYSGRVTVPVLWDKKTNRIVSNESADILRMFNSAFDKVCASPGDFYPVAQREDIDALNSRIYETVNTGVYKAGFATVQQAYEEAVGPLFDTLDWLEERLSNQRFLTGPMITEADWRLFTTLVRFDPVYFGHFKCNLRRIADYPNLINYLRDLYQQPGISETIEMRHIKSHYYSSHATVNPTGIVPLGPYLSYDAPHDRARLTCKGVVPQDVS